MPMKLLERMIGRSAPKPVTSTISLKREMDGPYVMRINGILHKSSLDRIQKAGENAIAAGENNMKILIMLSDFKGWKKGDDWGNIDFFASYQQHISRIAVVGDLRWQDQMLLFLAAGHRDGEVRYFPPAEESRARIWLNEPGEARPTN